MNLFLKSLDYFKYTFFIKQKEVVIVRKTLGFYLVVSTMMSSIVLAGKEDYLENLDGEGLKIVLKAVAHKYDISWEKEFGMLDPEANRGEDKVYHYLDEALSEKMRNYTTRMYALLGIREHRDFARLENKQKSVYDKQNKLSASHSDWFMKSYEAQEFLKASQAGGPSALLRGVRNSFSRDTRWDQEHRVDELDEKALKVAVQVLTNKKNKDNIYAEHLDLSNPQDKKRKDNIEKLLELLLREQDGSLYEHKRRKISDKIENLTYELSYLQQQLLENDARVKTAKIQRQQRVDDFLQGRQNLSKKVAAEQQFKALQSLDDYFLDQIRKDHANSMMQAKGDIPVDATLGFAMGQYGESAVSITKVVLEDGYVKKLIERALNLFQREGAVTFQGARKKISEEATRIGYPGIGRHLEGDHSNFPFFEKLTGVFCQLISDTENFVRDQNVACKRGLYGRMVYYTLFALKQQLVQGINDPSQLPAAFSGENVLNAAGLKEAHLKIQKEEDEDARFFLNFCQRAANDKENIQKLTLAKEEELKNLAAAMAKVPVSQPSSVKPSSSLPSPEFEVAPRTFRTTGTNKDAEIKYSAIYVSFLYQKTSDTAELIINHRTSGNGPEVRVYDYNTKAYINLGTLSPSMDFREEVFNLSPLIAAVRDGSALKTELNFTNGKSDIHSFKIQSGGKTFKEVILGASENQDGVYVYAGDLQEWSEAKEDVVVQ